MLNPKIITAALGIYLLANPAVANVLSDVAACNLRAFTAPDAAALRPHLPPGLNIVNATAAQLSDPSYATPDEAVAISATLPRLQYCDQALTAAIATELPGMLAVHQTVRKMQADDAAALMSRQMTWGQAVTHRRDLYLYYVSQLRQQVAAAQQQRIAAQQALAVLSALSQLAGAYYQGRAAAAPAVPASNSINCLSLPVGVGTSTRCY